MRGSERQDRDEERCPAAEQRPRPAESPAHRDVDEDEHDQRDDAEKRASCSVGGERSSMLDREHQQDRPGDHRQPTHDAGHANADMTREHRRGDDEARCKQELQRNQRHGGTLARAAARFLSAPGEKSGATSAGLSLEDEPAGLTTTSRRYAQTRDAESPVGVQAGEQHWPLGPRAGLGRMQRRHGRPARVDERRCNPRLDQL